MSNAFQTYASKGAELDFNEQRLRRLLAQRLMLSKEQREESLTSQRESDSSRGLLQSGIALKNQTDKNTDYDRSDAQMQQSNDDELASIARSRATAYADYLAAKAEEERAAALTTPLLDEIDPLDPLGWNKIAAERKAAGDPTFQDGYVAPVEAPNYTNMASAAVKSRTNKTPVRSVNKPRSIFRPMKGAY